MNDLAPLPWETLTSLTLLLLIGALQAKNKKAARPGREWTYSHCCRGFRDDGHRTGRAVAPRRNPSLWLLPWSGLSLFASSLRYSVSSFGFRHDGAVCRAASPNYVQRYCLFQYSQSYLLRVGRKLDKEYMGEDYKEPMCSGSFRCVAQTNSLRTLAPNRRGLRDRGDQG